MGFLCFVIVSAMAAVITIMIVAAVAEGIKERK